MNELANRTLTIEQRFESPIQLVWETWAQAEQIANWWAPQGMNFTVARHDFAVGGSWQYIMQMPDGKEFISEGVFAEIIQHKKIKTSANFKPMTEGVTMIALFEEAGAQTLFTFSVIHPTEEYCKQQEQMGFYKGWGSVFDRLRHFLKEK